MLIDGGRRNPTSDDGILCGISIHRRPKRWPTGLFIGLAIVFGAIFAPAVAQAITIW